LYFINMTETVSDVLTDIVGFSLVFNY
jgi:hypothetical protein